MLAGNILTHSAQAREDWCQIHRVNLKASGRKQRNFHKMGAEQYAYMTELALECGAQPLPEWFEPFAEVVRLKRLENPICYRESDY